MPTTTYGWVHINSVTGLREWETFTTTFPGPDPSWKRVFQISCVCTDPTPSFEACDVFLCQGANIYLMVDFTHLYKLGTGSSEYTDIAITTDKLYARKFSGDLDEWTMSTNSITLTTPNIFNIGTGTSLGSDGTELVYDISSGANAGKVGKITPGVWVPTITDLGDGSVNQGDIMKVGNNSFAATVANNGSSMQVWSNTTPYPVTNEFLIQDSVNALIVGVYGLFQKSGTFYVITNTGTIYSLNLTTQVFTQVQQISFGGDFYTDWNGAAQTSSCGTVELLPYRYRVTTEIINAPAIELQNIYFRGVFDGAGTYIYNVNQPSLTTTNITNNGFRKPIDFSFYLGDIEYVKIKSELSVNSGAYTTLDDNVLIPSNSIFSRTYAQDYLKASTLHYRYTIIVDPPLETSLSVTFDNSESSIADLSLENVTVSYTTGNLYTNETVDIGVTPFTSTRSVADASPNYNIQFTQPPAIPVVIQTYANYDSAGEVLIDTFSISGGDLVSKTYDSSTATTSVAVRLLFIPA